MSPTHAPPLFVAILGADALLAARPHDPVQVTHACHRAGFELVVPVSWGEEVLAMQIAKRLARHPSPGSYVSSVCPLVDAQLQSSPTQTPALRMVPPAIATARYVRAALQPRRAHVTYVGACPGAADPDIDVHCLPSTLFMRLIDAGIDIARQPRHFDGQLPVERARYASTPGGMPEAVWLAAQAGARVVEAAPITVDVVTQLHRGQPLLIDLAVACKCVCARDRMALARLEPPRASGPVTSDIPICVTKEPEPGEDFEPVFVPILETAVGAENRDDDRRARFAENGLEGDATPLSPGPDTLSRAIEPW
jgi:hypothetical protein